MARQLLPFLLLLLAMLRGPCADAADTRGSTIRLHYGTAKTSGNPVADFMYFVPLISPAPVSSTTTPGCTQEVRVISSRRRALGDSFTATCEMELEGRGGQRNIFDLAPAIRRHESQLQNGGSLQRQLRSIDIQGAGAITVEVKGAVTNDVATVNEVKLHFNAHGRASPVSIDLCDIHGGSGGFQPTNEILARVNTLTFRRKAGPATMEISVASVKSKDAGDGFWANLKGGMAGMAANMLIKPLRIETKGEEAMLDFGQALASGAATFTFPRARNLQPAPP